MTPEEFERLKEEEKAHLRELRALKDKVRTLKKRQAVNRALGEMTGGPDAQRDVHQEMLDKLDRETAMQEARLDIALENTDAADTAAASAADLERSEEELVAARARALLQQLKQQMGGAPDDEAAAPANAPTPEKTLGRPAGSEAAPPPVAPEKTLGRPTPEARTPDAPASDDAPETPARSEKTIGRMK